jgi:Icc-related predicted phosphoesterase
MIRIAAVSDMHVRVEDKSRLSSRFAGIRERADLLLLPGDLTGNGALEEAQVLAGELSGLGLPVLAVLGNHDFDARCAAELVDLLEREGVRVLDGERADFAIGGERVGVIGLRGFLGGFDDPVLRVDSREPEIEAWMAITEPEVAKLERCLREDSTGYRVVMLHYSPIRATVVGVDPETVASYGSSRLCEPIDRLGADLVVHGHAHRGTRRGATPGGIPVFNVADPILDVPYVVLELGT